MSKMEILVDDLDGSTKDVESVRFSLDGSHYEIDLNRGNANELRTVLAAYQAVARPSRPYNGKPKDHKPASSPRRKSGRGSVSSPSPAEVREWAQANGIDVNPKGRVPKTLVEQYVAAKP
jgi:hypothetical protein